MPCLSPSAQERAHSPEVPCGAHGIVRGRGRGCATEICRKRRDWRREVQYRDGEWVKAFSGLWWVFGRARRYGRASVWACVHAGRVSVCVQLCVCLVCRSHGGLQGASHSVWKNEAKAQKRPQMGRSRQYARQVFTTDSQDRHWDVMIVKIVKIIS
jgi:hypothetical protein